jgi:hypothetical protein
VDETIKNYRSAADDLKELRAAGEALEHGESREATVR